MNKIIIRLTFCLVTIAFAKLDQGLDEEFRLNESRESDPELYWEWDNEPRWLSGRNWGAATFFGSIGPGEYFIGSSFPANNTYDIKIVFDSDETTYCQTYRRDLDYAAGGIGVFKGSVWDISVPEAPRRLNVCFVEWDDGSGEHNPNLLWDPDDTDLGRREYLFIMDSNYDGTGTTYDNQNNAIGGDMVYAWWPRLETGATLFQTDPAELRVRLAYITNFKSYSQDNGISLEWEFEEDGIDHFDLFASTTFPPEDFLVQLDSELREYTHTDVQNNEKKYYQLKGIDLDGNVLYNSQSIWGKAHPISENMNLLGNWDLRSNYGDIWGYTDEATGIEYALLCARSDGLSIIDISNEPVEVGFISSASDAKDVKVYENYAVLIMEYTPAKVIDLSDPANPVEISTIHFGSSSSDGGSHNCYIDGQYLYAIGHDAGGIEIYDLSTPESPQWVGDYSTYYYHDIYVKDGIGYAAGIYGDGVDILDVSNPTNVQLLANFNYEGSGAHNCWTTEDGNYVIVGDEIGTGNWARIFDIQDLNNIIMVAEYIVDPLSVVHNTYVKGDLLYIGHYTEGVRIVDISDPTYPEEKGYYDTHLQNEYGYEGCWSVFPYFDSGKIIASDMQLGLFVLEYAPALEIEINKFPTEYKLKQNYPNPFNPKTTINYAIGKDGFVNLSVFDITGKFIKTLVHKNQSQGLHFSDWNGRDATGENVVSGIYLIKIEIDDFSQSRKMILLK
tara:strand:- start:10718 stop:12901 length:2184 start_codon:yes stop_codon:yes gene_type:complete